MLSDFAELSRVLVRKPDEEVKLAKENCVFVSSTFIDNRERRKLVGFRVALRAAPTS